MFPHRIPLPLRFALTLLLAAVCLVLSSHAQAPATLPRIAVLTDDTDKQLVSFADLLTAYLSQKAKGANISRNHARCGFVRFGGWLIGICRAPARWGAPPPGIGRTIVSTIVRPSKPGEAPP